MKLDYANFLNTRTNPVGRKGERGSVCVRERENLNRRLYYYLIVLIRGLNCRHLLYILKLVLCCYYMYLTDLC